MSEFESRVNTFFESYRAAFERLDAPAIADHYAYPSHITSDTGEIVLVPIAAREEWIGKIERLLDMYRAIGFCSARTLDIKAIQLSPRLVQIVVHWALYDGTARTLYDFEATYTLAKVGDALRIAAVSHNEILQYRECLARLQSQRGHDDDSLKARGVG